MKKRNISLLISLLCLLAVVSCRKDDLIDCTPTTIPTTGTTIPAGSVSNMSLADFSRRNGAPVQTFTVTIGQAQTITTSAGATLALPATGWVLPSGAAASGAAQLRLREIYQVPDMLLSNMPTQTGSRRQLLVSGGEFSIQLWQNGARLRLTGAARVVVNSPKPTGAGGGQSLWQQPANRVGTDSTRWFPVLPASASDSISTSSVGTRPSYYTPIPLDSVSWWNIDRLWSLYQTSSTVQVTVQPPTIPANATSGTQVFLRPVGYNGLINVYANAGTNNWVASMPVGASMIVIVLQSVNGQLYYGTQAFTAQNGLTLSPALTPVSEADAVRLIKQL